MKKIKITISFNDDGDIVVSNDLGINLVVEMNSGMIKASDIFTLFDNGVDVSYECDEQKKEAAEGQNLSRADLMFNDCLELVNDIVLSINEKINEYIKSKKNEELSATENE